MKKCNISFLKLSNYLFITLLSFASISKFYKDYYISCQNGIVFTNKEIFSFIMLLIFLATTVEIFIVYSLLLAKQFNKKMLLITFLLSFIVVFNGIALLIYKIEKSLIIYGSIVLITDIIAEIFHLRA